MERFRLEQLRLAPRRRKSLRLRFWREYCFARVLLRHFRIRFLIMCALLVGGGLLFQLFEPERNHSLVQAMFFTWSLVFGEPPEDFPHPPVLQAMFFVVPVLGLTVIIEGIVDLALTLRDRKRHERGWCSMMASTMSNHIVLVGLGKLGYRTYRLLMRLGERVVVVEKDPNNQFLDEVRRDGMPLFVGDARREAMLQEANVSKARSVIAATNDDLANLEIALDARHLSPGIRVVVRLFDQRMADKIRDGFNIHLAMSESAISASAFATAALDASIASSIIIDGQLVVMRRWTVKKDGPLCRKTVAQVMREYACGVVEQRAANGRKHLFPTPDTILAPGDVLLVQGKYEVLLKLGEEPTPEESSAGVRS